MIKNLVDFVPHRPPMLLLDHVIEYSEERLVASVTIKKDSFGVENGFVPGWFGIEYMAQSIAAYNGLNFSKGGGPEIGFLVGSRGYKATVPSFAVGQELIITVERSFIVENSGSFQCRIDISEVVVAEAIVTTYKPNQEFIEALKKEAQSER